MLFYSWFYWSVFGLYASILLFSSRFYKTLRPTLFSYFVVNNFPKRINIVLRYIILKSYITDHREYCRQWCYQDALSGPAPWKFNRVSACELFTLKQALDYCLAFGFTPEKESWSPINSFWVLGELSFFSFYLSEEIVYCSGMRE